MIELGRKQALMVVKHTEFGAYLGSEKEQVLLPKKYVEEDIEVGDSLDVFVYRDSKDRLVATTLTPKISLGEVAVLKVKQVTGIGAFLDWGLEKDLMLPFKEQTTAVQEGYEYPVALYIDKSNRLAATMKLYPYLVTTDAYHTGDTVYGTAYEYIDKYGMFVAVDNRYHALIPKKALYGPIQVGDPVRATVSRMTADGKIELAVRGHAYEELDSDAAKIEKELALAGGSLPYGDKSDPAAIKEYFGMSKAAFKRACGHLLKAGTIRIEDERITHT